MKVIAIILTTFALIACRGETKTSLPPAKMPHTKPAPQEPAPLVQPPPIDTPRVDHNPEYRDGK